MEWTDLLFGKRKETYSDDERWLIRDLVTLRMRNMLKMQGYCEEEAYDLARELVRRQDLSGDKIVESPT